MYDWDPMVQSCGEAKLWYGVVFTGWLPPSDLCMVQYDWYGWLISGIVVWFGFCQLESVTG